MEFYASKLSFHLFYLKRYSIKNLNLAFCLLTQMVLIFNPNHDFYKNSSKYNLISRRNLAFDVVFFLKSSFFCQVLGDSKGSFNQYVRTYVCVSGGKKCQFFRTSCVRTKWITPKYKKTVLLITDNCVSNFKINLEFQRIASENNTKLVSYTTEGLKKIRTTIISMGHESVIYYVFTYNHVPCPCTIGFTKYGQ